MGIPDYQTLMLPVLEYAADGVVHTTSAAIEAMAQRFSLTQSERDELLPSGRMRVINNRTHWALTYLRHAGLLATEGHGRFRLTKSGEALLARHPAKIDRAFLVKNYPEIQDLLTPKDKTGKPLDTPAAAVLSPEEQLEASDKALRAEIEHSLLERLKAGSPLFFEKAVLELLVAMRYGGSRTDAMHVGKSGDGGIDGVIKEDELGLDNVYVQAKRWDGTVGRPVVQTFAGSLEAEHARKGVLITTSSFTAEARQYVRGIEKRIVLIDGAELARRMVDHGVGVQAKAAYTVYRVDEDFFDETD